MKGYKTENLISREGIKIKIRRREERKLIK